ncbi:MAG TPA: response regulator [Pseudomonadales bacterium]|nr:response regulator [Pseudomonadales bacterium]
MDASQDTAGSPTVDIIDDDEAVRFALMLLMETCGWQARTYGSVEEFLETHGEHPRPDCLILDLNMKGLTGADLIERIHPDAPIIVITGYADSPLADRARRAGVRALLRKPFSDDVLIGHIREALGSAA